MKINALEGGSLSPACPLSQSGSPQGQEVTQQSGEGDTPITPLLLPLPAAQAVASPGYLSLGLALGIWAATIQGSHHAPAIPMAELKGLGTAMLWLWSLPSL